MDTMAAQLHFRKRAAVVRGAKRLTDPLPGDVDGRLILTVVLYGDGKFGSCMRGNPPSSHNAIKEELEGMYNVKVLMTDESNSTKVRTQAHACSHRATRARTLTRGRPGGVRGLQHCVHCKFVDGKESVLYEHPDRPFVRGLRWCPVCGLIVDRDENAGTNGGARPRSCAGRCPRRKAPAARSHRDPTCILARPGSSAQSILHRGIIVHADAIVAALEEMVTRPAVKLMLSERETAKRLAWQTSRKGPPARTQPNL